MKPRPQRACETRLGNGRVESVLVRPARHEHQVPGQLQRRQRGRQIQEILQPANEVKTLGCGRIDVRFCLVQKSTTVIAQALRVGIPIDISCQEKLPSRQDIVRRIGVALARQDSGVRKQRTAATGTTQRQRGEGCVQPVRDFGVAVRTDLFEPLAMNGAQPNRFELEQRRMKTFLHACAAKPKMPAGKAQGARVKAWTACRTGQQIGTESAVFCQRVHPKILQQPQIRALLRLGCAAAQEQTGDADVGQAVDELPFGQDRPQGLQRAHPQRSARETRTLYARASQWQSGQHFMPPVSGRVAQSRSASPPRSRWPSRPGSTIQWKGGIRRRHARRWTASSVRPQR